MPVVKFAVSEEHYQQLLDMAKEQGVSIQDIVRNKVFGQETIFTPAEAVKRALKKYKSGDKFTIPELYGEEWSMQRGAAGVFGKQFFNYVSDECKDLIRYVGPNKYGRQAEYEIL